MYGFDDDYNTLDLDTTQRRAFEVDLTLFKCLNVSGYPPTDTYPDFLFLFFVVGLLVF